MRGIRPETAVPLLELAAQRHDGVMANREPERMALHMNANQLSTRLCALADAGLFERTASRRMHPQSYRLTTLGRAVLAGKAQMPSPPRRERRRRVMPPPPLPAVVVITQTPPRPCGIATGPYRGLQPAEVERVMRSGHYISDWRAKRVQAPTR